MTQIKDRLNEFAQTYNILAGICTADRLTYLNQADITNIPFTCTDADSRVNPKKIMPKAKSIIAVGVGYELNTSLPCTNDNVSYGKLAVGVMGTDYHIRVKKVMHELVDCLLNFTSFEYTLLVDNHPLIEREFAKKAGIGWQGKNCMLISKKFGSLFNIGLILTDLELEPDEGYANDYSPCGECDLCIKACIGNCLEPYHLDYKKCVSYLTQKKEALTELEKLSLRGYIYGCDICQLVCSYNTGFSAKSSYVAVEDVIKATNKQIKASYGSAAWRGKKILSRNAENINKKN